MMQNNFNEKKNDDIVILKHRWYSSPEWYTQKLQK